MGAHFSLFHIYHNRFLQIQNQQNFALRSLRNKNVLRRYLHKKLVLQKKWRPKMEKTCLTFGPSSLAIDCARALLAIFAELNIK